MEDASKIQMRNIRRKAKKLLRKNKGTTENRRSFFFTSSSKKSSVGFEEEWEKNSDHGNANSVDPDLYRSIIQGNVLEFVQAIEKGPADRQSLDSPATCIQVSPQNNTALHIATAHKHHEIVNLICKDLPFFIPEKNCRGETALHIAVGIGDSLLVSLLINAVKDKEIIKAVLGERNEKGNTALHKALRYRHEKAAEMLIDRDRDMKHMVHAFVINNIMAQSSDVYLVAFALKLALPLLGVSLVAMSIAFMTGLHLVVSSLPWLGYAVLFMGLMSLSFVLCLGSSNCCILRYISCCLFRFIVFAFPKL